MDLAAQYLVRKVNPHVIFLLTERGALSMQEWDDAIEVVQFEDTYFDKCQQLWLKTLPSPHQRQAHFTSISDEEKWRMRERYLLTRFELLVREKLERGTESTELKKIRGEFLYRSRTTQLTNNEIEYAKSYPMTSLIETRNGKALCPFHTEKTPSLTVKKNLFYCFGCQRGGDTISYVMEYKKCSFPEAVRHINSL